MPSTEASGGPKTRVGVVGLGKMGISHCAIVNMHPAAEVVAVCDQSSIIREAFKRNTKMSVYSDYQDMLKKEELDCIYLSVPTDLHTSMVEEAMINDLGVFCEKPFALDISEGKRIVSIQKEKGIVNQVGYHNRFLATFNAVKKYLNDGIIGNIHHFDAESYGPVVLKPKGKTWRSSRDKGGGCLYDYASHVIDLVHFILGDIEKVSGTQLKSIYSTGIEDAVYSMLNLKNGIGGALSVNWSDEAFRKMTVRISVFGDKGKIISDAQELKIYLRQEDEAHGLRKGWNIKYLTDFPLDTHFYLRGEEYSAETDYFVQSVRNGNTDGISSFESALKTDQVISWLQKDGE